MMNPLHPSTHKRRTDSLIIFFIIMNNYFYIHVVVNTGEVAGCFEDLIMILPSVRPSSRTHSLTSHACSLVVMFPLFAA